MKFAPNWKKHGIGGGKFEDTIIFAAYPRVHT